MSHSDLATSTCQHPVTDTLIQSNMPTRCFYCGWVRQHSALILPKAFNALSGKYQFLGKMIYWLSCTSLELRDFNTHKVSFEMRGKRFSVPVLVSGRGQPRIQMQVEQSKRKEFGEEGSGKRTAGLFCRKQSAAK